MQQISEEDRQRWRSEVLATTAADFVEFAERLDTVAAKGSVAVVASETALGEANKLLSTEAQLRVRPALE
jgi:Zn-dependent M16 (insulinase) family peptidase